MGVPGIDGTEGLQVEVACCEVPSSGLTEYLRTSFTSRPLRVLSFLGLCVRNSLETGPKYSELPAEIEIGWSFLINLYLTV